MNKYRNRKIVYSNAVFDSSLEATRFKQLQILERAGLITHLRRQVRYEVYPNQYDENGKKVFRRIEYVADFVYVDTKTGEEIVEDTKGIITSEFKMKEKLFYGKYKKRIHIVRKEDL